MMVGGGENPAWELGKVQKIVSFKEENKGWVSFKSFLDMENGISVADKYFTFKGGKAYFHNSHDVDRNTFYGQYTNSSITVLLNDDPGTVKTFNTLNYEGSQTKVDQFVEYVDSLGFTHTDKDYYNLANVDGWWVTDIHTDMQNGGVPEFINKENKWFNYITGADRLNEKYDNLDESEFSFQGLGTVASFDVTTIVPGCTDPNFVEYNPLATTDDGSCLTVAIPGCMNASATNYDATANVDDGSCQIVGCTWALAFNYQPPPVNVPCQDSNGTPNGTGYDEVNSVWECCEPVINGCMTANIVNTPAASPDVFGMCAPPNDDIVGDDDWPSFDAYGGCYAAPGGPYFGYDVFNYNPLANTEPANACSALPGGCTDSNASNYAGLVLGMVDDGSCVYEGCTDAGAYNYNSNWTVDDGSCCYNAGCTDDSMLNYDPAACFDDGSCVPCAYGCMDINDNNYDPLATCHDCANYCAGVCGCNDLNAANYDASATSNDGSCIYAGCLDPTATNTLTLNGLAISCMDISASYTTPASYIGQMSQLCGPIPNGWSVMPGIGGSIMDGVYGGNPQTMYDTCVYVIPGCTDVTAFNYNASATTDDGSCYPVITGCMDPLAVNFVPIIGDPQIDINTSDPTACCYQGGCTDPNGTNYDPNACWDDGSCIIPVFGCMDTTVGLFNTAGTDPNYQGYNSFGPPTWNAINLCSDPSYTTDQFGQQIYVPGSGCWDANNASLQVGFAATNYDPMATACPPGTSGPNCGCTYRQGCTDSNAYNYDPSAFYPVSNVGSGIGCTDGGASNYDPSATTDDGSCCYGIIEGCLHETFTNALGEDFENYNYGSGSLGNPYNVQGWSQYKVIPNPVDITYDVNTHDQNMCILKDGTATTHTTNNNSMSNLYGERNGAGCTDNVGADSQTVDYWFEYHAGSTVDSNGNPSGPFKWSNVNSRVVTINTYHGSAIASTNTHPYNYNENWTEYATLTQGSTTWPIETDFYESESMLGGVPNPTNHIVGGGGNIEGQAGAPWSGNWDAAIMNSCCRQSGCLHPYALNFDAKGYKRNPNSPMDPIYVGVGVQRKVNGQIRVMEKADQDAPGGPNNPYDQIGPATANNGINFYEGGNACMTCTGDPNEVPGYNGGTTGTPGERFQKLFNNGMDEDGNWTGDFSPKNRCGNSSGNEIWTMADKATCVSYDPVTGACVGGSAAEWHAQNDGCMDWRIDDPIWADCCVFPSTEQGGYVPVKHFCYNSNPPVTGNGSYVNYFNEPSLNTFNYCGNQTQPTNAFAGHTTVMAGGCTNPNACSVVKWDPVQGPGTYTAAWNAGKRNYESGAMWDDGSCCWPVPLNSNGSVNDGCNYCQGVVGTTPGGPGGASISI